MGPDEKPLQSDRAQTDESLRAERARTDVELSDRLALIEEAGAAQVEDARAHADQTREAAREATDRQEASDVIGVETRVAEARAEAELAVENERTIADEKLRLERRERNLMMLRLLPSEREKTDQYLLTERGTSDTAISNRDDFLSIVSHDLRNLLSTLAMSAQRIERHTTGRPDEASSLEEANRIRRIVFRMTRLVDDLVDVSSIESGELATEPTSGEATSLVTESVEAFAPTAAGKGVGFGAGLVEGPLRAVFDRGRVQQVLANLVGNAIKFTPPGGNVRLDCVRVGDSARISVRDTGPGIPNDALDAVFERFWQIGKNDKRGMGLGLYIARGIVTTQRGRIWAESVLGRGSTFHFTLPLVPPVVEPTEV